MAMEFDPFESERVTDSVEVLVKVFGDGSVSQDEYELRRKATIEEGTPTWLVERTRYGGLHIQYWELGENVASIAQTVHGCLVINPNSGALLAGYLSLTEAVALAEMGFDSTPF